MRIGPLEEVVPGVDDDVEALLRDQPRDDADDGQVGLGGQAHGRSRSRLHFALPARSSAE